MSDISKQFAARPGFFSLKNNETKTVRIVSELYPLQKAPGKFASRIVFVARILDRSENNATKLWEIGSSIKNQLLELIQNPSTAYEDMPPYDIEVNRTLEGEIVKYTILPLEPTPLTESEKECLSKEKDIVGVVEKLQENERIKLNTLHENQNEVQVEDINF